MELPITLDLTDLGGGREVFRTPEELEAWVNHEFDSWSWLGDTLPQIGNPGNVSTQLNNFFNIFAQVNNNFRSYWSQNNPDQAWNVIRNYYGGSNPLPPTSSTTAKAIFEIRDKLGPRAGIGALATFRDTSVYIADTQLIRGIYAAHEILSNTGNLARKSVQDGIAGALLRAKKEQDRAEAKADALDELIDDILARNRHNVLRMISKGKAARRLFSAQINDNLNTYIDSSNAAIESIKSVEATFEEHMRLKAPVTYWRLKSKQHRLNSWIAGGIGLAFAMGLVAYAGFKGINDAISLIEDAVNKTHQPTVAYAVLTLVVFLLTIAFWIGRLVSRTYVSQSHLAIDAEERATLVETYLALTKESLISTDERILVLTSLFRASSDGLVKDDGSPDIGLPGLASRLATGQGAPQRGG